MKKLIFVLLSIFLISTSAFSQPERIGAGLTFATKQWFNQGNTGNPGLNLKTWIALDKRKTMHIVPSVTVFNPLQQGNPIVRTNYMFFGDLDFQYKLYHEGTLKFVANVGANYTQIISNIYIDPEILIFIPEPPLDSTISLFGGSVGAAIEMRMSSTWDFILSAKYNITGLNYKSPSEPAKLFNSRFFMPVIQIHAVYYFLDRGKGYSRR